MRDQHVQAVGGRLAAWAGLRWRAWLVGVQVAHSEEDDLSLGVMLGPLYVGVGVGRLLRETWSSSWSRAQRR